MAVSKSINAFFTFLIVAKVRHVLMIVTDTPKETQADIHGNGHTRKRIFACYRRKLANFPRKHREVTSNMAQRSYMKVT